MSRDYHFNFKAVTLQSGCPFQRAQSPLQPSKGPQRVCAADREVPRTFIPFIFVLGNLTLGPGLPDLSPAAPGTSPHTQAVSTFSKAGPTFYLELLEIHLSFGLPNSSNCKILAGNSHSSPGLEL